MAGTPADVAAGVTRFVMRPVGSGDHDVMDQARQFVERILPEVDALNR